MPFVLGVLLLLIGFAMLVAGIGLLIGGDVALKSGNIIPKEVGRRAGIVFLSFFPLGVVAHFVMRFVDADHSVPRAAIYWPLALVCSGLGGIWLLRGRQPPKAIVLTPTRKRVKRSGPAPMKEDMMVLDFDADPETIPLPDEPPAKQNAPGTEPQNPFNFS